MKTCLLYICSILSLSEASLKFMVLADWGGLPFFPYKTFVELSVGREMAAVATKLGSNFILALGDNFYLKGVTDVNDIRFKKTFEDAFDYDSLKIPWFIVAGNHDHYGNVSAQIAYTFRSDRWKFPDLYYQKTFKIPFSNSTVDIVMIDTVILCGNTDPENPLAQPLLDSIYKYQREQHWIWLEDTLKSSRANYIFVCGHYPVYSIGSHGPTYCLVKRLKALLDKYQVSAYFSGHDHNLQHIQMENSTFKSDFFVTGSSNFIDPSKEHLDQLPPKSLLFHWANPFSLGAFTYVEVSEQNMTVSFVSSFGKYFYSYSKKPLHY